MRGRQQHTLFSCPPLGSDRIFSECVPSRALAPCWRRGVPLIMCECRLSPGERATATYIRFLAPLGSDRIVSGGVPSRGPARAGAGQEDSRVTMPRLRFVPGGEVPRGCSLSSGKCCLCGAIEGPGRRRRSLGLRCRTDPALRAAAARGGDSGETGSTWTSRAGTTTHAGKHGLRRAYIAPPCNYLQLSGHLCSRACLTPRATSTTRPPSTLSFTRS